MSIEQFANNASSTLNGSILAGATSLTVTSATGFPTTGNFRLLIDSEIFLVTSVAGAVFTVSPGQEGTTQAGHTTGATVTCLLTKQALLNLRGDGETRGVYASRPTAGNAGVVYRSTDGPYLSHDNGSTWQVYAPIYPVTPPVPANWSWVNQGGSTLTTTNGTMTQVGVKEAGSHVRGQIKAIPAAPYTITAALLALNACANNNSCCLIGLYDGTGFITLDLYADQTASNAYPRCYFLLDKWTNNSTFSASYTFLHGNGALSMQGVTGGPLIWVRLTDDNATRHWQFSLDGINWIEVANQARTDFITPTNVFWGTNANSNTAYSPTLTLVSYLES